MYNGLNLMKISNVVSFDALKIVLDRMIGYCTWFIKI